MITYIEQAPDHDRHYQLLTKAHPDWHISRKERVINAFTKSSFAAAAYDEQELVGTIRAIADGVGFVLLADLLVLPNYRQQGIATTLVNMVRAVYPDCYIYADPGSAEAHYLYQKLQFKERTVYLSKPKE